MTTTAALQPLTPKQREVFDWIVDFYKRERIPPTFREIQSAFRFLSTNAVTCHLLPMVKKGWLIRYPNTARAILPTLEALANVDA
jgi:repressor LexA